MQTTRRNLLAGASALAGARSYSRVLGANERVRIAVIGAGGRGQYLMKEAMRSADAAIPAVCDVYNVRREQAAQAAGPDTRAFADYRQVLALKDIDGVIVATPDHWHAAITVDACAASKDVYCEKPMVHTPRDGQAIVSAARRHKRVIQVGTQGRGQAQNIEARDRYVRGGILGKVGMGRTWYMSNRGYIQTAPPGMQQKPAGLDWDRWIGPGPKIPWNPEVYFSPYKWLHYDGGMIMGIGIHVIDTAHFMLGLGKPKAVSAAGGVYYYNDGRDTPDTVALLLDYPEKVTLSFEAECLSAPGVKTSAGVELRGTGGKLFVERYATTDALEYTPNDRFSKAPASKSHGIQPTAEPMIRDWIACIRSRNKPIANEVEAYWSTMACYMGNIAYQKQTRIAWDPAWNLPAD